MWTDDIESIILTKLKYEFSEQLKTKYANLDFTTEGANPKASRFPCVYLQKLPSLEMAQSLDGTNVSSAMFSFQITVIDNTSRSIAKRITDEVVNVMKKMRFTLIQLPISENENSLFLEVIRFRRLIAEGDIL